jgi:hypothetical protein
VRLAISSFLFVVGAVLGALVAARLIFGVAVDLPLLPRWSLAWVGTLPMTVCALASFAAAGLVGRTRRAAKRAVSGSDQPPG